MSDSPEKPYKASRVNDGFQPEMMNAVMQERLSAVAESKLKLIGEIIKLSAPEGFAIEVTHHKPDDLEGDVGSLSFDLLDDNTIVARGAIRIKQGGKVHLDGYGMRENARLPKKLGIIDFDRLDGDVAKRLLSKVISSFIR